MNNPLSDSMRKELEQRRAEIDAMLLAGLNSGEPIEVDEAFWEERRRRLKERLRQKQA